MRYLSRFALLVGLATGASLPFHSRGPTLAWSGGQCILSGTIEHRGGATIEFDTDADGTAEQVRRVGRDGRYVAALRAADLTAGHVRMTVRSEDGTLLDATEFDLVREAETALTNAVAEATAANLPTSLCGCDQAGTGRFVNTISTLTASREAGTEGVSLADGAVVSAIPLFEFQTIGHELDVRLFHHSLTGYAGPVGAAFSHSFNSFIVQDGPAVGRIVTPDLRVFPIAAGTGDNWILPEGFFAALRRDAARGLWVLTHHSGEQHEYILGTEGLPGNLFAITDTNENRVTCSYDASGRLSRVTSPTNQVISFGYNAAGLLTAVTDPIGRRWALSYRNGRMASITSPRTDVATIPVTASTSADAIASSVAGRALALTFEYQDAEFPDHLTAVRNALGQEVMRMRYDAGGRVAGRSRGGVEMTFTYDDQLFDATGSPFATAAPAPRPKLDPGNRVTRVVDRVGSIVDVEMHGEAGGPIGGTGKFGTRRVVQWTERGVGRTPLRSDEPTYWERRWLHDSNSLTPKQVSAAFRSDAMPTFDVLQMPTSGAQEYYTYNQWRQVTTYTQTDGQLMTRWERTYQPFDPSLGAYSRLLTSTDPRQHSAAGFDVGLAMTTSFEHDTRGNLVRIVYPAVTRGQATPQAADENFVRNARGQLLAHENAAGDITTFDYFTTSTASSSFNHPGSWSGYVSAVTHGASGSTNQPTDSITRYSVNNLGVVTSIVDAAANKWRREYTALGQLTRETTPAVDFGTASLPVTRSYIYDSAGRRVLERTQNLDHRGQSRSNAWLDVVMARDARGAITSMRREVDADPAHDLMTSFAYDGSGQAIALARPDGTRVFRTFDERGLPLREFAGVARSQTTLLADYPTRAATSLAIGFLTSTEATQDGRGVTTRMRDGRGNLATSFQDALGRQVATRDANGNGARITYDAAGNPVTVVRGVINAAGRVASALERTYYRYDERNRRYLDVTDGNLATDESAVVDPRVAGSVATVLAFGTSAQPLTVQAAGGATTTLRYDAAGHKVTETDAIGNVTEWIYNALGQKIEVRVKEVDGLQPSTLVTSVAQFQYDALGRVRRLALLGKVGNFQPNEQLFTYDAMGFQVTFTDEAGQLHERTRDDLLRVLSERISTQDGVVASYRTRDWDANSRLIAESDLTDVTNPASAKTKRYAWDGLDRLIRRVDTDSDDPVDGSSNGADGIFDRMEWAWDANSNILAMTDERGLTKSAVYDAGNRQTSTAVSSMGAPIVGVRASRAVYDALGRTTEVANDFARSQRTYNALGMLTQEVQSMRLDGTGFTRGWIEPIALDLTHDAAQNLSSLQVRTGALIDLALTNTHDVLGRLATTDAAYMNGSRSHRIAAFTYDGVARDRRIVYGNGATWLGQSDALGRIDHTEWKSASAQLLAGFDYAYDRANNPLWERVQHDGGRYDNFGYGELHQMTGAQYRATQAVDYRTQSTNWGSAWTYDDRYNRTASTEVDAFGAPALGGSATYQVNAGMQYASIVQGSTTLIQQFDRFGAAVRLPVYPRVGADAGQTRMADATYDIHSQTSTLTVQGVTHHYVYDEERRRVASFRVDGNGQVISGRRYVHLGQHQLAERDLQTGAPLGDATSRLRQIFVHGERFDQLLFTAIDGNGDGAIGNIDGDPYTTPAAANGDFAYYYAYGGVGSVAALLHADDSERVLEYYRHTTFGEATVLPIVDVNQDGREDTGADLSDNYQRMLTLRAAQNDASIGRFSKFGNAYTFAGRRLDPESGHVHMRARQFDPVLGRFTSRDWVEEIAQGHHPYGYVVNRPSALTDPLGLEDTEGLSVSYTLESQLDCPEEWSIKVSVSMSVGFESPGIPIGFGLDVKFSVDGSYEGSGGGTLCLKPKCMSVGQIAGGFSASISGGVGSGIGGVADVRVGVRGSVSGSADYDPCAGKITVSSTANVSVFASFTIELGGLWSLSHEVSFTLTEFDLGTHSFSGPALNCSPCPCCEGPELTTIRITEATTISQSLSTATSDVLTAWNQTTNQGLGQAVTAATGSRYDPRSDWAMLCSMCCQ